MIRRMGKPNFPSFSFTPPTSEELHDEALRVIREARKLQSAAGLSDGSDGLQVALTALSMAKINFTEKKVNLSLDATLDSIKGLKDLVEDDMSDPFNPKKSASDGNPS